ncbi:MAG TPA: FHA domain-containing protein [Steroidobacteraceae bacterium]|nr:FHA domain-containing protein [Steroidobacteraceae bacterium]
MSVPRHTVQDSPDLETTAELPVLDVAAYEAAQEQGEPGGATSDAIAPGAAALDAPAPGATGSYRGRLEEDLKALSTNLREFEERLAAQGKRSTGLESEIDSLREVQAAAEQRASGLDRELTDARSALAAAEAQIHELMQLLEQRESALRSAETRAAALAARLAEGEQARAHAELRLGEVRAQVSAQLEALQAREGRRGVRDALFRELDGEAQRHESRAAELERVIASRADRARELEAELETTRRRSDEAAARAQSLNTALAAKEVELASLARINEELRQSVRAVTESGAETLERLQKAELDAQSRAEAHARELGAALARQRELESTRDERRRELDDVEKDRERRFAALQAEAAALRTELAGRSSALAMAELRHAEDATRHAADTQRAEELDTRVADYARAAVALQQELTESRDGLRGAEGDLRIAEDAILRLEAELRAKATRIEELTKLNDDWRDTLEAARESIEERDSLIRRLEAEAAHSTALLDNLQHSMLSLEASPGGADDAAAQSATRLLIRAEGETEVVHVLGRKTSIGRTPDNDVQIDTKFVSRHHAVILTGPAHTVIEDLNSTNGLLVNGQRVTRQNLEDGDAIIVGNAQFRFAMRAAATERRPL